MVTCPYNIRSPFRSTTHDRSSQTKQFLYDVYRAVRPMENDGIIATLHFNNGAVTHITTLLYKAVKSCVQILSIIRCSLGPFAAEKVLLRNVQVLHFFQNI